MRVFPVVTISVVLVIGAGWQGFAPGARSMAEGSPAWSGSGSTEEVQDRVFMEAVQVHVVNIDVFVSDASGRPVTGLQREDFELLVDGRPVPLSNFFAAGGNESLRAVPPAPGGAPQPVSTGVEAADPAARIGEEQRLNLVIMVDARIGSPSERALAISHVQHLVRNDLPQGTWVMAAAVDRGVSLRQTLTPDREAVISALEELKHEVGEGVLAGAAARELLNRMERARQSGDHLALQARRLEEDVRAFAEEARMLTKVTARELAGFVDALAGVPGRKAVLFLSGGMPVREGEAMFEAWTQAFPSMQRSRRPAPISPILEAQQFDATPELEHVIRRANAGRVVFFTVDIGAIQPGTDVDAGTFSTLARDTAATRWRDSMSGLVRMAGGTGGRTFISGADSILGASELLSDLGTYYSLGFEPQHRDVGKHRRIRVRVRGRDVHVRHVERVLVKSSEERFGDRVTAGLHFGEAVNPLEVRLDTSGAHERKGRHFEVPLRVTVPAGRLGLVLLEGRYQGRLTMVLRVRDTSGRQSGLHHQSVSVSVPAREIERNPEVRIEIPVRIQLQRGRATIALLVHDDLAGTTSVATLEVNAG